MLTRKQGLILLPILLTTIACDVDDQKVGAPDSPLDPGTNSVAEQIQFQAEQWVRTYDAGNEVIAISITPMVDDFSIIMLTEKKPDGSTFNKNLYAEKGIKHSVDSDGDDIMDSNWSVGYLDENVMKVMAKKYGFDQEVEKVASNNVGTAAAVNPQYQNSWLNNYLLWHMIFNRPATIEKSYYTGNRYIYRAPGYRPYAPAAPLSKVGVSSNVWAIPRATNGVSSSIISGRGSVVSSKFGSTSVSRGGFGATGRGMSAGS